MLISLIDSYPKEIAPAKKGFATTCLEPEASLTFEASHTFYSGIKYPVKNTFTFFSLVFVFRFLLLLLCR
jgi:hypothetical protein